MKPIVPELDNSSHHPLYIQLYRSIRDGILKGELLQGEKLPSLRRMAQNLHISITTAQMAYNQLLVEGYIISRPQSGYYVAQIFSSDANDREIPSHAPLHMEVTDTEENPLLCDPECFDFNKWKKCSAAVFNEYSNMLLYESNPQGELALRFEIAKYIHSARGVTCSAGQIVIGAGTQQITAHLCLILSKMNINHVSLESPGYLPVQSMFRDRGFTVSHIPVHKDGIEISKLPVNIFSAVYVSPSNQFPTGAVMPVGRRYQLLDWAAANNSIIIEDDYDSELRYFGKPVPALRSLDQYGRVVYLGSFSSTLFPAIKVSYMVLPSSMSQIFNQIKSRYTQTCSKAEQLTLALFMEKGYYYTGIRKLRNLYSQKLNNVIQSLTRWGKGCIKATDTQSGINLIIRVRSKKSADVLCALAKSIGLQMIPVADISDQETTALIFYYNQIPLAEMDQLIKKLTLLWDLG